MKAFQLVIAALLATTLPLAQASAAPVCKVLLIGKSNFIAYSFARDKTHEASTPQECVEFARSKLGTTVGSDAEAQARGMAPYKVVTVHYKFIDGSAKTKGWVKSASADDEEPTNPELPIEN